jgi:hypothetical protein
LSKGSHFKPKSGRRTQANNPSTWLKNNRVRGSGQGLNATSWGCFQGQILDANKSTIVMAVTADGIEAKKPEVQVTMAAPLRVAPVVGSNFQVQAVPDTYDPNPFLMKMVQGEQIGAKPAPAKKPAAKRPTTKKQ